MDRHFQTLSRLIAAWKARDVDTVLSFMTDDIVWHYAAAAMPPVRGKAAAGKLLQRFLADMHEVSWRIFTHAETDARLFVEGVDEYRTPDGRTVATPYAGVLDFRDGLICGWRDYVDLGVAAAQKSGAPRTKQVAELLERPLA
ncbi:MAG TPA: nuclear transport factor 2 family protein [Phenylobacterium sp.]|nr:nuclear transport factor 2 family protein [Phenylobacterium sp.]